MQLKSILPVLLLPAVLAAETGTLTTPKGICPLKHTEVKAKISGPLARVTVTQEFENPFQEKIEAVYTFPLPADSAVDDMTMLVGDRTIRGLIKPRDEARKIYEEARRNGRIAGLLDQERPNIFTQAVANIMPGAKVKIEISYVETMPYEGGSYEFHFPMVVAPRYLPTRVPDASRISPPVTPEGTRAGHDISVEVSVDAGVPIEALAVEDARCGGGAAVAGARRRTAAGQGGDPQQGLHPALRGGGEARGRCGADPSRRQGRILHAAASAAGPRRSGGGHAQGTGVRAGHLRLHVGLPHREGQRDYATGARRAESARHLQPDHVLRRYAHPVSEAGTGHCREPAQRQGVSAIALRGRRHRDDEGDPRGARAVGRAGPRAGRVLHDGRRGGERFRNPRRGAAASGGARVRVRNRELGEPLPARRNGPVRPRRSGVRRAEGRRIGRRPPLPRACAEPAADGCLDRLGRVCPSRTSTRRASRTCSRPSP